MMREIHRVNARSLSGKARVHSFKVREESFVGNPRGNFFRQSAVGTWIKLAEEIDEAGTKQHLKDTWTSTWTGKV